MKTIFATLTLIASLGTAHATPQSATEWMAACESKRPDLRATCRYYVLGFGEALNMWMELEPKGARVCIPDRVNADQMIAVAQKYYRENPKERHLNSLTLLGRALIDAWPCQD